MDSLKFAATVSDVTIKPSKGSMTVKLELILDQNLAEVLSFNGMLNMTVEKPDLMAQFKFVPDSNDEAGG